MKYQQRGEWLASTSRTDGAETNAVAYSRGARGAVENAESMTDYGPVVRVSFKGAPAGRFVQGAWTDVTNSTLAGAIERAGGRSQKPD